MKPNPLTTVLSIPPAPLEIPTAEDWTRAEATYGPLPTDYVEFVNTYGTGCIDDFLWVLSPASPNKHVNLITKGAVVLEAMQEVQRWYDWPFAFHPTKDGLVPVALTDNGDTIFWKTVGPPDRWPIIAIESRGPDTQEFAMTLSAFLAGVLQRTLVCDVFPRGLPSDAPDFRPVSTTTNPHPHTE